ncbi:MAG: twin-arginine translocase TatA/TatE family subunit [Alistipes sp.]|nr:twin-arginine translocase TatA/TatE family subunit [Alistipes sp.]
MLGTTELLLLGGLALLVFGGKKVPEMMRGLGQGVKEFKKGMQEDDFSDKTQKSLNTKENNSEVQDKDIPNAE